MINTMEGQLDNLKPRKRKSNSEPRSSRKVPASGRCARSPRNHSAAESSSVSDGCRRSADPLERISRIRCECHLSAGRRRCSASPEMGRRGGKENELKAGRDGDGGNNVRDKREADDTHCEESGKVVLFPDDDSNEILPVEQFFGNLDTVQDFPQRSSAVSLHSHREHRRRHYYAPEDSDDDGEEGHSNGADT